MVYNKMFLQYITNIYYIQKKKYNINLYFSDSYLDYCRTPITTGEIMRE